MREPSQSQKHQKLQIKKIVHIKKDIKRTNAANQTKLIPVVEVDELVGPHGQQSAAKHALGGKRRAEHIAFLEVLEN